MAYFTTHGKLVHCVRWDMNITLSGKYYFFDESKPYSARFVSATCPVAQNCSIPMNDQTEYKGMRCQYSGECELLYDFPKTIDVRNG